MKQTSVKKIHIQAFNHNIAWTLSGKRLKRRELISHPAEENTPSEEAKLAGIIRISQNICLWNIVNYLEGEGKHSSRYSKRSWDFSETPEFVPHCTCNQHLQDQS